MTTESILDEAARWHVLQDSDAMDWDKFGSWLQANSRHRIAFDEIALLDADIAAHHVAIIEHLGTEAPNARGRARWRVGAMAVSFAAAAAAGALLVGLPRTDYHPAPTIYQISRGQMQEIALRDGSRIVLASSSRLTVSGPDQDRLAIAGSAYFDIPHRPRRDLAIEANDVTIHDVGTRFAIDAGGSGTRVAVAEGAVSVSLAGASGSVSLTRGRVLWLGRSAPSAQLGDLRPSDVASWRRGALVYEAAPLTLVADDIARYSKGPITVDPAIAARRFSGVLSIGDGSKLAADVAAIMALRARPVGNGVRLESDR